jgi:hypothetical protein
LREVVSQVSGPDPEFGDVFAGDFCHGLGFPVLGRDLASRELLAGSHLDSMSIR